MGRNKLKQKCSEQRENERNENKYFRNYRNERSNNGQHSASLLRSARFGVLKAVSMNTAILRDVTA